jgi:AcrR family transcriptional regulator
VAAATQSRRERLRAETTEEITTTALALLAGGGPDAITLRAIAREMGMTAGAIYGYFPTRDDLITRLISDVYTSLVDAVEAARDACPPEDAGGRIIAWGRALREWSVANPAGFRLVYGNAVPGYRPRDGGVALEPARRACAGLTQLVAAAWVRAAPHQPAADWADFTPELVAEVRRDFPDLPPAAVGLALRMWGRMHGLVALEVYGHLRGQTTDPAKLYEAELHDLVRSLGWGPDDRR